MNDSTRRTLRTVVAVLVAVAAMIPVLVQEAGLDPGRWPWLAGILAVAAAVTRLMASPVVDGMLTRLGLGKDPADGRHELGRGDDGRSRPVAVVLAAVVLLAVPAGASPAAARYAHRGQVVHPAVTSTGVCDDETLVVGFDTTVAGPGRRWLPLMDDGTARLELHEHSGRSGPDGVWGPPPAGWGPVVSGGEHRLRWPGWGEATAHGMHYDLLVVVVGGWRSVPAPIETRCAA